MPFLNPDRKPIIRHPQGHSIDVIVTFKPDGDFIPLYFRLEDDYQERFTFKVDAISSIKDEHGIKIFNCVHKAYGLRNVIALVFDITRCKWVIG